MASRRDHGVALLVDIRSARRRSPQARHRGCRRRRPTREAPAGVVPRRGRATIRRRRGLARRSSHLCEPVAPSRGVRPRAGRAACAATADGLPCADARDPRGVEVGAALDTSHRSAPQMVRMLEHDRRAGACGAVPAAPSCRCHARQCASPRAAPGCGSRQRLCGPASPIPPAPASDRRAGRIRTGDAHAAPPARNRQDGRGSGAHPRSGTSRSAGRWMADRGVRQRCSPFRARRAPTRQRARPRGRSPRLPDATTDGGGHHVATRSGPRSRARRSRIRCAAGSRALTLRPADACCSACRAQAETARGGA